jgi:hypothetical protein
MKTLANLVSVHYIQASNLRGKSHHVFRRYLILIQNTIYLPVIE